jgi:uncharacterized protein YpmB
VIAVVALLVVLVVILVAAAYLFNLGANRDQS